MGVTQSTFRAHGTVLLHFVTLAYHMTRLSFVINTVRCFLLFYVHFGTGQIFFVMEKGCLKNKCNSTFVFNRKKEQHTALERHNL